MGKQLNLQPTQMLLYHVPQYVLCTAVIVCCVYQCVVYYSVCFVHHCVLSECVCAHSVCSVVCVHLSSYCLENLTVPTALEGCHCEGCSKIGVGCS